MKKELTAEQQATADILNLHVDAEVRGDLAATLATMTDDPHVHHVPTLIGGIGAENVKEFYSGAVPSRTFFPADTKMVEVSRTIDREQIVLEMIFTCTHTSEVGWLLPGVQATGKRIEIPLVVIAGVKDGKVSHEHIYWDQASVLVQIGLLDPKGLPVHGVETAGKMAELVQKMA